MKIILLLAGLLLAEDARIAKVQGTVRLKPDGDSKSVRAKAGDTMIFGDSLRTGAKSVAHVVFGNGTAILIQENSSFVLQGSPERLTAKFRAGEFLIGLRKKLKRGSSFRVSTPAAVAAVRGTLFWGRINADKSSDFAALENEVEIAGAKKTVVLKPWMKTSVPHGGTPAEPVKSDIDAGYPAKTFAVDGSLQGLEQLLK
jgi:hypothetical protein